MVSPEDRDFVRRYRENDAIVSDSKAEAPVPRPGERLNIAAAGCLRMRSAREGCERPSRARSPVGRPARTPAKRTSSQAEFPEDFVVRHNLAVPNLGAGFPIAAASPSVTGSSSRGADSAARYAGLAARYSKYRWAAGSSPSGIRSIRLCRVSRLMEGPYLCPYVSRL